MFEGKVDAIILTGGLAYGKDFVESISKRINWIADVIVHPGENEFQALAEGALRVLNGEEAGKSLSEQSISKRRNTKWQKNMI